MVMLKQSINGMLNTVIATIAYLVFLSWRKEQAKLPSFRQLIFVTMLSFALFPAFSVFIFHLKSYMRTEQKRLIHSTAQTAELAQQALASWIQQQKPTDGISNNVQTKQNQSHTYKTPVHILESVAGQSFLPALLAGSTGSNQKQACIDPADKSIIIKKLKEIVGSQIIAISILDTKRRVVVTTNADLREQTHLKEPMQWEKHSEIGGVYHYIPEAPKGNSIMQRWRQSLFIKEEPFETNNGWIVHVETSLVPLLNKLTLETTKVLASMLLLALAVVTVAASISKRLVGPLQALRNITKEMPLEFQGTAVERVWPDCRTQEVSELTTNFKHTLQALHHSFDDLKASHLYLQSTLLAELQHHHEKERLIKDIHDGVGGIITNIIMLGRYGTTHTDISNCHETLHKITELAADGAEEIRSFMNSIEGGMSAWSDLLAELKNYAEKMLEPYGIKFTVFKDISVDAPEVKTFRYVNIVKIFREGITNIVKHAQAHNVKFVFVVDEHTCMISLEDDGIGCDLSMLRKRGLASMKSRARSISADIYLSNSPEGGTTIRLNLPLAEPKHVESTCI